MRGQGAVWNGQPLRTPAPAELHGNDFFILDSRSFRLLDFSVRPKARLLGCAAYAKPFVHNESGLQQPMAVLGEVDYLRQRGSPLASWLETFKPDSPYTTEFHSLVETSCRERDADAPRKASRLAV